MATYMLIEINCDHLKDLDEGTGTVGTSIVHACRNPARAGETFQDYDLHRVLRVVGQTGERINANHVQNYQWLWKP